MDNQAKILFTKDTIVVFVAKGSKPLNLLGALISKAMPAMISMLILA